MKKIWKLVIAIATMGIIIMLGCAAVMDGVTPCELEEGAVLYSSQPKTKYVPWTTLLDSKRIDAWLDYKHEEKQIDYRRLAEDDSHWYGFLKDRTTLYQQGAMEFQQTVFSPEGAIGLLIPTLFGGTLGALLIPRLGEKEKIKQAKEEGKREANNKA